ncbi:MAG: hypothetical protein PHT00_01920 [Candidatus Methanomethylophilus sp.]|nr:hypothetical protein [Methanomethylophilus sp.]
MRSPGCALRTAEYTSLNAEPLAIAICVTVAPASYRSIRSVRTGSAAALFFATRRRVHGVSCDRDTSHLVERQRGQRFGFQARLDAHE